MGLSKTFSFIFCYFFIITNSLSSESIEDDPDEYYGVPLGALHYSAAGTSAEVYAADEYTIVFNHFTHRPQQLGCTSMMIGPPRSEDIEDVIPGHGVLIGIAQPLIAMRRRAKRQFGLWKSNVNLPRQFDHLFMEPTNGTLVISSKEKKAFSGIRIQHENKETKDITIAPPTTSTTPTTTVPSTTSTSTTQKTTTTTDSTTTRTTSSTTTTRASRITKRPSSQIPSRPLILFNNKASSTAPKASRTPLSRWSSSSGSSESQEGPGIMLMSEEEHFYRKPNKVHSSFMRPLPRDVVTEIKITTTSRPVVNKLRLGSAEDFPRRAPAQRTYENNKYVDEWETTTKAPSTPLFWVIPDPHEKRRRERLEELRRHGKPTPRFTTTTQRPTMDVKFALPSINDRAAAFTLTNGAKITDYLWIGLYDQCEHKSVPLISLKNIDPPREERIAPLSGWSHNVTSYRVQILNCNTILIPGFIFDGQNSTSNTYFYVGIGHFPDKIERQEKATIVGQKSEDPLRSYDREDVLIRLPSGYRTFDIDFISIYNTDGEKSYGHVLIPSLLVPPCAED